MEEGFILGKKGKVINASYYSIKDLMRSQSFSIKMSDEDFLPFKPGDRKEEVEFFLENSKSLVKDLIKKISEGYMSPNPFKEELCENMQWSRLCRHPQPEPLRQFVRAGAGAGKTRNLVQQVVGQALEYRRVHQKWPRTVITTFYKESHPGAKRANFDLLFRVPFIF